MSRWFRHYAGMMRDDKLVSVAIRSKQTIERVVWVWGAILENAAEVDENGRFDVDAAEIAYFLRADEADIHAVIAGLEASGRIASHCVVKWGDRQFQSDRSASRQAAYRERKRSESTGSDDKQTSCDAGVTSPSRHGDAPETETDTETEKNPPKPPRKRRGEGKTVLPDDWVVPSVSELSPKAKACAEQWTQASYETVAEAFVLYWRRERKMVGDWHAAWCGWVIREHAKVMRDQKFGNAAPDQPISTGRFTDPEARKAYLASLAHNDAPQPPPTPPPERARFAQPIGNLISRFQDTHQ